MSWFGKNRKAGKVEKIMAVTAEAATGTDNVPGSLTSGKNIRGINVYNVSQLMGYSGITKEGERVATAVDYPFFVLTVPERIDIARLCGPVFGVIAGRQQRIAGMRWKVTAVKKNMDREYVTMKELHSLFTEYAKATDFKSLGVRIRCVMELKRRMPDVLPDLSNFQGALMRWKRRMMSADEDRCSEIEDWLTHPNQEDTFENLTKKAVFDMHTHGGGAIYKETLDRRLENIYILPGGTVNPVRAKRVGMGVAFIQIVDGEQPQLFFQDELSYLWYAPRSDNSYGQLPIEALVNKVAEVLLFDQRAAEMADGTKPPEKLIAFGDRSPFGGIGDMEFEVPLDKAEQKRLETVVNEARKEAIRVITGYGTPAIVDVSRADTFQYQSERQRMVREEVGLVFGASAMEMNLSGSENTSGRNTSEAQERSDLYKGVYPVIQTWENFWNYDVLPFRFGSGFRFAYEPEVSEAEVVKLQTAKKNSGLYSTNEIRTDDMGMDPFEGEEYDKPDAPKAAQPGTEDTPLITRSL